MKALVTGATGFVGSHVVRALLKAGHEVRILRRASSSLKLLEGLSVETSLGDITDAASVSKAVQGCDAVFHVAGFISYWKGHHDLQTRINVDGTRHVVEACLAHSVKRLVHTSSIAAIGFAPDGGMGDEALTYNWDKLRIHYNNTKQRAEQEVRKGIEKGLDAVIVNPTVVFGPGDMHFNSGKMVAQMAQKKIPVHPKGGCCTCDVSDVADGHLQAFLKGRTGERYILGGENYTWKQLFRTIADVVGVPPPKMEMPAWFFSIVGAGADWVSTFTKKEPPITPEAARAGNTVSYYSSDKAIRELGYRMTPFRETVKKTYDWYKENGYLG